MAVGEGLVIVHSALHENSNRKTDERVKVES